MLELAEQDEQNPCHYCPMESIEDGISLSESHEFCRICQEFVRLTCMEDPIDWPDNCNHRNPKCPCSRSEEEDPIDRAWHHIIEYEKNR